MTISICTIVKNEKKNLEGLCREFGEFVDEIIVIDTGSTDGTLDVKHPKLLVRKSATEFYLERYPKNFHFANARNESIALANGDWVCSIDVEYRLPRQTMKDMAEFLAKPESLRYNAIWCRVESFGEVVPQAMFVRRAAHPVYKWRVHEIMHWDGRSNVTDALAPDCLFFENVMFKHERSIDHEDPVSFRKKRDWYCQLMEKRIAEDGKTPYSLYQYAIELKYTKRYSDVVRVCTEILTTPFDPPMKDVGLSSVMVLLAEAFMNMNNWGDAEFQLRVALMTYPHQANIMCSLGQIHLMTGNLGEAEKWFKKALATPAPKNLFLRDHPAFRDEEPKSGLRAVAQQRAIRAMFTERTNVRNILAEVAGNSTHQAALISAVLSTNGPILELGCGYFSTPLLRALCASTGRELVSIDTNKEWATRFGCDAPANHSVIYAESLIDCEIIDAREWSVVLIDHVPEDDRHVQAKRVANRARYVVLHDAEPENDHRYHYSEIIPLYKYALLFQNVRPYTVVLSQEPIPDIWNCRQEETCESVV